MSGMSVYLSNQVRSVVLLGGSYTPATPFKLALFTDSQSRADDGTEVAGNGYARGTVAFQSGPSDGQVSNSGTVTFTSMPAATLKSLGVYDNSGNLLVYGDLAAEKSVSNNDSVFFNIAEVIVEWE